MKSVHPPQSPRSPMKSLFPNENIPLSVPPKSIQLGIESFTKKRERSNLENPNPRLKKVKVNGETVFVNNGEAIMEKDVAVDDRVICHQCRQHVFSHLAVRCTGLKKAGSKNNPVTKRCPIAYCRRCLENRYDEKIVDITAKNDNAEGHVADAGYTWSCPSCRKECNCSVCRKKMGLAAVGYDL